MPKVTKLTHERLLEVLAYDEATGFIAWKVANSNSVKVGQRAGVLHANGARYINLDGEKFLAHRLAWFYVKKEWPEHDIRPLNGNFDDCRIENLKDVPRIQIAHLRGAPNTNTSGFLGVSPSSKPGKWQASITWNYSQISLGANFPTPEDAAEIYNAAAARLKDCKSQDDANTAIEEIKLFRRQRAVWNRIQKNAYVTVWPTFEDFAKDIKNIPARRHAMVAEDMTQPLGPQNYRWSMPIDFVMPTSDRAAYSKAYTEVHRKFNKVVARAKHIRKFYGADAAYERKLLVEQNGLCAICEKPEELLRGHKSRRLSVDHNHTTKELRGLLCGNCNMAVGYFCDDPEIMKKAAAYIEKCKAGNVVPFKKGEEI